MGNDTTSLALRPGSAQRLTQLAERRGIKQTRGAGAALGLPSVTGFVDAIARGEYVAIRPANGDWPALLHALDQAIDYGAPEAASILADIKAQIETEARIVYFTPPPRD